jgi:hypothetical protein
MPLAFPVGNSLARPFEGNDPYPAEFPDPAFSSFPLRQPASQDCINTPRLHGQALTGSRRIPATYPKFQAFSGAGPIF